MEDALIALEGLDIRWIHLGHEYVQVASSEGGGTLDKLYVFGVEKDSVDQTHKLGGGPLHSADTYLPPHSKWAGLALRCRDVLVAYVYSQPLVQLFDSPGYQSAALFASGLPVYHLMLVFGPERPGDSQQVDGLEEAGLALGVSAEKRHYPWRQVQL